jgi:uncharacterized OB-fold protein
MAELRICQDCGTAQGYPRPACHACGGRHIAAVTPPLRAEVFSLTTVHRAPSAHFAPRVPYTLALVRPAGGGLLLLPLHAAPGHPAAIGDRVIIQADGDLLAAVVERVA